MSWKFEKKLVSRLFLIWFCHQNVCGTNQIAEQARYTDTRICALMSRTAVIDIEEHL